ncbi:MAG: hypothetical protein ACO1OO_11110 [Flavisolibacter sp.]
MNNRKLLSIAAGGGFYDVQPGTEALFCFIDEVKNFCWALFVRQNTADSDLLPMVSTSCPTCSNTFVSCRFTLSPLVAVSL